LLCCALSTPALAAKRLPDVVEDAQAYALTDRSKAVQLLEDAADNASAKDHDIIAVHAGEQRRLSGDNDEAHTWFTGVLVGGDRGGTTDAARLGLALLQAGDGSAKNLRLLRELPEKGAIRTQNADRYLHLAVAAARNNNAAKLGEYTSASLAFASDDPAVEQRIRAALEGLRPGDAPSHPVGPTPADPLEQAEAALAKGDKAAARQIASRILADTPENAVAAYLLRRVDAPPVRNDRVAILLPFEGKYGAVGKQVQQALTFGHTRAGGTFELVFVDSGASAESAVKALEDAVIERGAVAVVGPLLSDETDAVVAAAEALRVPLISLSQSYEDTRGNAWVFQAMMTTGDQVDALISAVMGDSGMKNFAIFSPSSSYGERAASLFSKAAEAHGGTVTVHETYDAAATDIIPFAKKLGRKDYEARQRELWDLKRAAKENGGDPSSVVLPPVIDFDAIFLPENASRVPLACAALAYEEFPMGDFRPTKDSPTIPLLGLSGWNNHSIVGTGGPYARRGWFTDAFLTAMPGDQPPWTPPEHIESFIADYREALGRTPSPLEAITVDAGQLLAMASAKGAPDRAALRDALLAVTLDGGVTGATGFDPETRRATRELLILSVSEDAIVPRAELPEVQIER
jgi:ABC-type branched-subunit amino acid transport system substrate-binding protein